MFKVLKNEIVKTLGGKKVYILTGAIIVSIILMAVMGKTNMDFKMTAHNFVIETLGGMIMKPLIPIFMVLVVSEAFTEDYANGTMKFSLMTPIKRKELVIGKFLFIAVYAAALMIISFIFSYIVGIFAFGDISEFVKTMPYNIECYTIVMLPILAFSAVLSFLSLFVNNNGAMIGAGISIYFIMVIVNQVLKNAIYFTFSGGMLAYDLVGKAGTYNIMLIPAAACLYIVLFLVLSIAAINKKDIVL
ncbi:MULTISPECIES: ABC transporter permease [Clostridium]|uniref:ABC transporter permease n=1 Tax=Clostridium TaxID=1485 RepID=UPI0008253DAF|nr:MULTISPECIES: ABC transporter permease subunit [Clostridium]PJI07620.1 ABC transporter permease [Clostridium sp. CT7]